MLLLYSSSEVRPSVALKKCKGEREAAKPMHKVDRYRYGSWHNSQQPYGWSEMGSSTLVAAW